MSKLPTNWKLVEINDLIKNGIITQIQDGNHGGSHPVSTDFVKSGIPFVMANCFNRNKLDLSDCHKISIEQYKSLRIGFSKPNDVLLTHKGTVGLTAVVEEKHGNIMLTPQVTYYRIGDPKQLLNYFLYYFFQSTEFQSTLKNLSAQTTRAYIGITEQKNLNIIIPPLTEQKKIAEILTSVDRVIELTNQEIDKLKDLKKGMMQELFTKGLGHTKFKDSPVGKIPDSWEVGKLSELASTNASSVDKKKYEGQENIKLCNYLEVYRNDYIEASLDFMESTASLAEIKKFKLRKGDVVITKDSEVPSDIGIPAYVSEEIENLVCGYHLYLIRPIKIQGEFLSYVFTLGYIKRYFNQVASGSTRFGLNLSNVENLLIPIPSKKEQLEICLIINKLNEKIFKQKERLTKVNLFKKGLMNDLLTGKVRVKV